MVKVNRLLSKLAVVWRVVGDLRQRNAVHSEGQEDSSAKPTNDLTTDLGHEKKSSESCKIPFSFAKNYQVLPIGTVDNSVLTLYTANTPYQALTELRRYVNNPLQLKEVAIEEFSYILTQHYQANTSTAMQMAQEISDDSNLSQVMDALPKTEDLLDEQSDAPIIRLLNALLSEAIKEGASDVHIESFESQLTVRFRIDGMLRKILEPQHTLAPLIVSRIKVMAKLNIAEKRLPQDGRIALTIGNRNVDVRVSTLPTSHGERVVLRLLDKRSSPLDLQQLGMSNDTLHLIERLISKPHGILLVTGPTGSGKTTTLYAALTRLNNPSSNILTVEDPVEYYLPGIGQTQINPKANLTFAKGLRAILRQDPDIVMVGEIRDLETARIAIQASLTGHLVLSTLHTNTATGAITRLRDMGIENFLIASSLVGVVAQRLVRTLCQHCKTAKPATDEEWKLLGVNLRPTLFYPQGCSQCHQLGYKGRSGIYEVIAIDSPMQSLISRDVTEKEILEYVRSQYPSIWADGVRHVVQGDTTLAEILRVVGEAENGSI